MKININTNDRSLKIEGVIFNEDLVEIHYIIEHFEIDTITLPADTSLVTTIACAFARCSRLTNLNVSNLDTSNVEDMSYMFYNCINLTSLNVSNFNTSKVTDMSYMFCYCSGLTSLDISNFDTSNVTNMSEIFSGCSSLISLDLSSFTFENVEYFSKMFYGVPDTCEIIVKSEKEKQWLLDNAYELYLGSRDIKIKGE